GGGNEDAGLDQLLGEPVHRRERLERLGRGSRALFTVLSGFPEHHNPHRLSPCLSRPLLASHRYDERACWKSTSFCKFCSRNLSQSRELFGGQRKSLQHDDGLVVCRRTPSAKLSKTLNELKSECFGRRRV